MWPPLGVDDDNSFVLVCLLHDSSIFCASPDFSPDWFFRVLEVYHVQHSPIWPGTSLDWTDDIGDRVMSMLCSSALQRSSMSPVPVPQIPPAKEVFDTDDASQASTHKDTDEELVDEVSVTCLPWKMMPQLWELAHNSYWTRLSRRTNSYLTYKLEQG